MLNPLFQMLQQFKKEIDNFLQLASEFNKAILGQKKVDYYDKLFENV